MTIGVISDTHGLVRPEALEALQGVELILHAGDVGDPAILDRLREIAPVFAVRGNVDRGEWARKLRMTEVVEISGLMVYMLHDLGELDLDPATAGFAAVITGHSHQPVIERDNGVLYLNPGSAGPKRFKLPISLALMDVVNGSLEARLITLAVE